MIRINDLVRFRYPVTDKKELGLVVQKKVRRVQNRPWEPSVFSTIYGIYFEKKLIWLDESHELERVVV